MSCPRAYHRCYCGQEIACQYGRGACPYEDGLQFICDDCENKIFDDPTIDDEFLEDEEFDND